MVLSFSLEEPIPDLVEQARDWLEQQQRFYSVRKVNPSWERLFAKMKANPQGKDWFWGGGVAKTYRRRYTATTSFLYLLWARGKAFLFFDRPALNSQGDLPKGYQYFNPYYHLAKGSERAFVEELDRELRKALKIYSPPEPLFPEVVYVGKVGFLLNTQSPDLSTTYVLLGNIVLALSQPLYPHYAPTTLSRHLARETLLHQGLFKELLAGEGDPQQVGVLAHLARF